MRTRLRSLAAGAALLVAASLSLLGQSKSAPPQIPSEQERAARGQSLLDKNSGGPDLARPPRKEERLP